MSKSPSIAVACSSVSVSYDSKHPNKMNFTGVLVRLDEPSTKPPNGSDGHRILVPSSVAASRLKTLVGMGLNYAPDLEGHARRRKVGTITKAWIDGKDLYVKGHIWKHDFPEAERDLKQAGLGMSMEIGEVKVDDTKASVWHLNDFCFLGATILWKDAAAYNRTRAMAAAREDKGNMVKNRTKKTQEPLTAKEAAEIAAKAASENTDKLVVILNRQTKIQAQQAVALDKIMLALTTRSVAAAGVEEDEEDEEVIAIAAGNKDDEDVDDEEACDDMTTKKVKASKKKDEEDDEEDDDDEDDIDSMSDGVDKGDLEEMGPETGDDADDDDDPGHLSQGAKNKGSKTTSENKVGKTESMGVTGGGVTAARFKALFKHTKKLSAQVQQVLAENATLKRRLKKVNAQVEAAGKDTNRRSVSVTSAELNGLLAKANVDVGYLQASGGKMSVAEFDGVLASVNGLDIIKRMELKNQAFKAGLLEEGQVHRGRQ